MKKVRICAVQPAHLTMEQADQLVDQLYDVHTRIFSGVSKVDFVRYVLFPEARYTKIYLYKNADSDIVGYLAAHYFERVVDGRKVLIARGENGVLPAYRCHWTNTFIMIKEGLRLKMRYPFRKAYYLGCFVYPVIYSIFARYAHKFYPNPNYEIPPTVEQQLYILADCFHLPKVDAANKLIRQVGWVTRDTATCCERLQNSKRKSIQFYLQQNPNYAKGNGLLTLFPLTYKNILLSIGNVLRAKLKRTVQSFRKTSELQVQASACPAASG